MQKHAEYFLNCWIFKIKSIVEPMLYVIKEKQKKTIEIYQNIMMCK